MKSLKNYVKNYIKDYINESVWDIEDNVEDDNKEFVLNDIKKFIEDAYNIDPQKHCDIIFNEEKNKYVVNSRTNLTLNLITDTLTNGMFEWGTVKGWFDCSYCPITSLEGAPEYVSGTFACRSCKKLKSLKGAPKKHCTNFDCGGCIALESLEGVTQSNKLVLKCSNCYKITSLKGLPKNMNSLDLPFNDPV